jgi:uncharacterized protein DUF3108
VNRSLKLSAGFIPLVLFLAVLVPVSAQRNDNFVNAGFSSAPYRVGERLTFNVSFSQFISAAHVELEVAARGTFFGRDAIQLRSHVETTGVVNAALFAINNDYVTYLDPASGLPFRAQQLIHESPSASNAWKDFTQPSGQTGTYDFLSAIYRLRALPLDEGSSFYFMVRSEKEEYQAQLKVSGRQVIKTSAGSFNAIASQVHITNNSRANNYRIRIYFSDDERHLPVLITAKHSVGEIRAELAGAEIVIPATTKPSPNTSNRPTASNQSAPTTTQQPLVGNTQPVTTQPPSTGNTQPVDADDGAGNSDALPFKAGEQLNYQVYLGTMAQPVGNATFQVRARSRYFNHDGLLFAGRAQTVNAAQRLFVANDQITSYVDPKTLLPFRTEMSLNEGSYRVNQVLSISQDLGTATTDKGAKIDIPVGTHDFISFFYALRTFNLAPPRRNAISILANNKPRTLFITALNRETIQLGSQTIPAIQVSLTTDDPQSDKYVFRAWISDDKRHLPLRLTAATALGPLRADLAIIPLTAQ